MTTRKALIETSDYRRLTGAQRFALSELWSAWQDRLWRTALVWRLGSAEGPRPESEQGRWDETTPFSALCRQPGALFGGHFWRGTDQPFTDYSATN